MVRREDGGREKREMRWKCWGWGNREVEFGDGSRPSYLKPRDTFASNRSGWVGT